MSEFPNKAPRPDWDLSARNDVTRAKPAQPAQPIEREWFAAAELIGLHNGDLDAAIAVLKRAAKAYYPGRAHG